MEIVLHFSARAAWGVSKAFGNPGSVARSADGAVRPCVHWFGPRYIRVHPSVFTHCNSLRLQRAGAVENDVYTCPQHVFDVTSAQDEGPCHPDWTQRIATNRQEKSFDPRMDWCHWASRVVTIEMPRFWAVGCGDVSSLRYWRRNTNADNMELLTRRSFAWRGPKQRIGLCWREDACLKRCWSEKMLTREDADPTRCLFEKMLVREDASLRKCLSAKPRSWFDGISAWYTSFVSEESSRYWKRLQVVASFTKSFLTVTSWDRSGECNRPEKSHNFEGSIAGYHASRAEKDHDDHTVHTWCKSPTSRRGKSVARLERLISNVLAGRECEKWCCCRVSPPQARVADVWGNVTTRSW